MEENIRSIEVYVNSHSTSLSQLKKERNSSVELFRILATFLVLLVHLNGWMAGGLVPWSDSTIGMDHKIIQLVIQSLSIVCVNCFLVISGWYGLTLKITSLWKLWVMLVSIYIPFYIVELLGGVSSFSVVSLLNKTIAFSCCGYFIQNYLMLMFFSPALNAFIEKYKDIVGRYALSLFAIEVIMESVFQNKCLFIEEGFSLFHFTTMYMLARAASLNKEKILKVRRCYWVIGYFLCAAIVCVLSFTPYKHTWAYSNPIVVFESFMLFFPFLYKQFTNRFINRISGGAFVVYMVQVTHPIYDWLVELNQYALHMMDYKLYVIGMILFSVIFFMLCILYNELALKMFNAALQPLYKLINEKYKFSIK